MDIRMYTGLIIRKGNMYLVGRSLVTGKLTWSNSPFDAWITRTREKARMISSLIDGEIMLFNPAAHQIKVLEERQ